MGARQVASTEHPQLPRQRGVQSAGAEETPGPLLLAAPGPPAPPVSVRPPQEAFLPLAGSSEAKETFELHSLRGALRCASEREGGFAPGRRRREGLAIRRDGRVPAPRGPGCGLPTPRRPSRQIPWDRGDLAAAPG